MQIETSATLPAADDLSAEHSERCAAYIRERIADEGGSISFAAFMHHALYAPGLGYYTSGARKFGAAGDFVTAPEVSPLFGRVIAAQIAPVLEATGGDIVEFGAGSGRLAVDMLGKLDALGRLPGHYVVIEVSPDLAERQADLLRAEVPNLVDRVQWASSMPEDFAGVVIANEVLDALPVEMFVRRSSVRQVRVIDDECNFRLVEQEAPAVLSAAVSAIEDELGRQLPDGYRSEISLGQPGWVADIVQSMSTGIALMIDYGVSRREFYAPEHDGGWLRCHFRHRAHDDPLRLPGVQDITSWVDFSSVAGAAHASGASIAGYVDQARFLLNGGLEAELADLERQSTQERVTLSRQVKMLTLPGEMGERFKCLGISVGDVPIPTAFGAGDRAHLL